MATMSQIRIPSAILAKVPRKWPRPAPNPKWTESSIRRPPDNSKTQARIAAPAQEPRSVPSRDMGIRKVPITAPARAPISAPSEPRKRAPAFFAPTSPPRNSTNSPRRAKIVIATKV